MTMRAQRPGNVTTGRGLPAESDRGAVLVHTAFALLALTAFTTFVVDFGVFWLARGQAQNTADAAALAGAVALAYDGPGGCVSASVVSSAQVTAQSNLVYGQPPVTAVQCSDAFPECERRPCVRAEVYRDAAHGNPLPVFFGGLVGLSAPGARAMAIAQFRPADTTDCLRPWAIVDHWTELGNPPFDPRTSTFDAYTVPPEPDVYLPPTTASPGTGFATSLDYGRQIAVRIDQSMQAIAPSGPGPGQGWARVIELPAGTYDGNIDACAGLPMSYAPPGGMACPAPIPVGDRALWATRGCYPWRDRSLSAILSETRNGVQSLYDQDPVARWDPFLNGGVGGVTGSCCSLSPRVVPLGIMDIDVLLSGNPLGFTSTIRLANIVGFFVEDMGEVDPVSGAISLGGRRDAVIGRLVVMPGTVRNTAPVVHDDAAFMRAVLLVR